MAPVENDPNKKSIWGKIIGVAKTIGKVLVEEVKYFVNPMNWGHSGNRIRHEAKQAFKKALDNPTEEYNSPIKTTQASKNLGVEVIEYKNGKVRFIASRTLVGDIPHLNDEQLGKIKTLNEESKYSNITIYGEENKVVIEIDVEKIINDIKDDPKNKGISKEEIKKLALKEIAKEVDCNLKGLANITGGEFKRHQDLKLLNGIAEKLYNGYDNPKPSETMKPIDWKSSETLKSVNSGASEIVKPISGQPSETLRSGKGQELSETFKRLNDDGELSKIAQTLVDGGRKSVDAKWKNEVANDRTCGTGKTR